MPIEWRADTRQLHLANGSISYVMHVLDSGAMGHLYYGEALALGRDYVHLERHAHIDRSNRSRDPAGFELPTAGRGDDRVPGIMVTHPDGSTVLDLVYDGHRIFPGKPSLPGLPATYVEDEDEAESVEVILVDRLSGLEVRLLSTIYRDLPVITRSLRITNAGSGTIRVDGVASAILDLPDADWHLVQLSGTWGREFQMVEAPLAPGRRSIGSQRGSTSHQHNPFLLLRRSHTTEARGEALGLSLVYSGNFRATVEVDPYSTTRLRIGIDPETFRWTLEPGSTFQAPEAVLAWSAEGIGAVSDAFHQLYRARLVRGPWRDRPRPVLLNTWEATYHDFDEDRLLDIARSARDVGVELLVLDDGWFGRRDDDSSSLGDWVVDRRKLPSGLDALAGRIEEMGLRFGLWMEPEMVSPRSRLFSEHPDWAISTPGRSRTEMRNQYVLDLSRREVVDHLFDAISDVLRSASISYVKWDMNRPVTEPYGAALPPDRQREFFHRYMLGVYDLAERLTQAFPRILLESCASGGGRFDPGMLAFGPQVWTSDQTDAVERLRIQWGASLVYPPSTMGAHVAATPGHQSGRRTPIDTRAAVSFFGAFGYELDIGALDEVERARVADQIAWYLPRRELLQYGRFVRLRSPFEGDGNETAWMSVSDDRRHAVVGWYRVLSRPLPGPSALRLRGLDGQTTYRVIVWPAADDTLARINSRERGGDELMSVGILLDDSAWESQVRGDYQARLFELTALDGSGVVPG